MAEWLAAKNEQLVAWWTPNQDDDQREENVEIADKCQETMDRFEAEVKEIVEK